MENLKKYSLVIGLVILGLGIPFFVSNLWEDVDAGEVVVIQDPVDGDLHVYKEPGWQWQGWGRATHYKKSKQFWFNSSKDPDEVNNSIDVKWNDGGHASISGSIRYDLPMVDATLIQLHSTFSSQEAIENALIKTNIQKAVYMTGPLMSSKESYAEKRNALIFYIEDQASRGVYKTRQIEVKEADPLTGEEKMITRVEITEKTPGQPLRQEESPIKNYGIHLYNLSINEIAYDKNVEDQIRTQQQAIMNVQTAIANAKKAEQDAITIAKQGEALAAKAKWEQEVIKAKLVTEAESRNRVAELDLSTARLNKDKQILDGQGEAEKKRLVMSANGALEQKMEVWLKSQEYWANAFSKYQGNVTPMYMSGGSGSTGNAAANFMDIMMMKSAKDLNLDMTNK